MQPHLVLMTCCALLAGAALAAEPANDEVMTDQGYRGEFRRGGGALACVIGTLGPKVKPEDISPKLLIQPCLFVGPIDTPFVIGAEAQFYLDRLGTPDNVRPDSAGSTSYVYPLAPGDNPPFIVLTVLNNSVAAFQVTGERGLEDFTFNQVAPGAPTTKALERFGEPMQTMQMPDGATMWSYLPWPISFLISEGKVVSIRIANDQLR